MVGDFFFLFFLATVAQVGAGIVGGGWEEGVGMGGGAGVDPGFGVGEGDGGCSFAFSFRSRISLFRIPIWEKRLSVRVVYSFCISLRKPSTRRSGPGVVQYIDGSSPASAMA